MVERKRRFARWIVSFMICLFVGEIGTIEVWAATGYYGARLKRTQKELLNLK